MTKRINDSDLENVAGAGQGIVDLNLVRKSITTVPGGGSGSGNAGGAIDSDELGQQGGGADWNGSV